MSLALVSIVVLLITCAVYNAVLHFAGIHSLCFIFRIDGLSVIILGVLSIHCIVAVACFRLKSINLILTPQHRLLIVANLSLSVV